MSFPAVFTFYDSFSSLVHFNKEGNYWYTECLVQPCFVYYLEYEPPRGKNQQCGFRPAPIQTGLHSHRSRLRLKFIMLIKFMLAF